MIYKIGVLPGVTKITDLNDKGLYTTFGVGVMNSLIEISEKKEKNGEKSYEIIYIYIYIEKLDNPNKLIEKKI